MWAGNDGESTVIKHSSHGMKEGWKANKIFLMSISDVFVPMPTSLVYN